MHVQKQTKLSDSRGEIRPQLFFSRSNKHPKAHFLHSSLSIYSSLLHSTESPSFPPHLISSLPFITNHSIHHVIHPPPAHHHCCCYLLRRHCINQAFDQHGVQDPTPPHADILVHHPCPIRAERHPVQAARLRDTLTARHPLRLRRRNPHGARPQGRGHARRAAGERGCQPDAQATCQTGSAYW